MSEPTAKVLDHHAFEIGAKERCVTLLGASVRCVARPGGRSRPSIRVHLDDGRSVIVTRRRDGRRAELEARVLQDLGAFGAPVPAVMAFDGEWLIQEDLGTVRLSEALATCSPHQRGELLARALESLAQIHEAALRSGLHRRVVKIGWADPWLERVAGVPLELATLAGVPAPPPIPVEEIVALIRPTTFAFVKWDARPGNAIRRGNGQIAWYDWEHCGCRMPLDDLVWLITDETVAVDPAVESRLLSDYALRFSDNGRHDPQYLLVFGTLHMCRRLAVILQRKGDGPWWQHDFCLATDSAGVTLESVRRLCGRAARWARASHALEQLAPWLDELPRRLAAAA